MSKGNMLLGHARGKVGDLVFSRSNGQQVTRARASVVRNPRTTTQLIQRIILNTVSQAYSKMQNIVDHSWEGVQMGQQSMSRFMKVNLDTIRARVAAEINAFTDLDSIVAFSPLGSNAYAPNTYVISSGKLPQVEVTATSPASSLLMLLPALAGVTTYEDVINALGLKRGDQLTFCAVKGSSLVDPVFAYCRVILDPTSSVGQSLPLSTAFLTEGGAINMPSVRNTGSFTSIAVTASGLTFNVGGNLPTLSAAVIVSRQSSTGTWQRSNATLVLNSLSVIGEFPSLQDCLNDASSSDISDLSDLYLNNAGESTPVNTEGASISRVWFGDVNEDGSLGDLIESWPVSGITYTITDGEFSGAFVGLKVVGTNLSDSTFAMYAGNTQYPVMFSADGTSAYAATLTPGATITIKLGGEQWGGAIHTPENRP